MTAVAEAVLFLGVAVVVAAALSAVWLHGVFTRLHYLSPVTSVGGPLIGLGLAIENGWGLTTGIILFTVSVLAISGPVIEAAAGRVMAQREAIVEAESPE